MGFSNFLSRQSTWLIQIVAIRGWRRMWISIDFQFFAINVIFLILGMSAGMILAIVFLWYLSSIVKLHALPGTPRDVLTRLVVEMYPPFVIGFVGSFVAAFNLRKLLAMESPWQIFFRTSLSGILGYVGYVELRAWWLGVPVNRLSELAVISGLVCGYLISAICIYRNALR